MKDSTQVQAVSKKVPENESAPEKQQKKELEVEILIPKEFQTYIMPVAILFCALWISGLLYYVSTR